MKRKIVFGLIISLIFTLVACGGTQTSDESHQDGVTQETNDEKDEVSSQVPMDEKLSLETLKKTKESAAEDFDYLIYEGNAYISGYIGSSDVIVIPDEIDGCPVIDIGDAAFRNNFDIKAVRIGNNVTRIGSEAFINCTSLEYVIFGDSVESVGKFAFIGCGNVIEMQLNEGLLKVEEQAICEAEVPTIIPRSVKEIGLNGFKQPVKVYKGSYAESYIVDYANNYGAEFVYEIIE